MRRYTRAEMRSPSHDAHPRAAARPGARRPRSAEPAPTSPPPHARVSPAVSMLILVLSLVGVVQVGAMIAVEVRRYVISDREVARLTREIDAMRAEAAALRLIGGRGDDLMYREQLARRAGFAYPEELRVVIAPPP